MGALSKTTPTQQPSNMLTKIESAKNSGHYQELGQAVEICLIGREHFYFVQTRTPTS
jgi:hypothetical protein